jgi:dipeptidyl aminopeptidase/acylaminoacyl peptidase
MSSRAATDGMRPHNRFDRTQSAQRPDRGSPAIDNWNPFQQTMNVRRAVGIFLAAAVLTLISATRADSEIVIAIRYLQAQGTSRAHLYLYREDGKLLRQLTNDNSGQDSGPIFSPDGEMIVFTREKPNKVREFWSVKPRGTDLKRLDAAPDWYTEAKSSPYFTNIKPEEPTTAAATTSPAESASPSPTPLPTYKSPDGSFELILREDPNDEDDQINGPGHGKHYVLRDLKTGTETEFGKIPGFYGAFEILHDSQDKNQHFLFAGSLRLAFFALHLNSTDGDTVFALDLTGPRFVRLSPNWAAPITLAGEAGLLTFTENRYVPISGSNKTANCSYIERWDERLNHVRYAREKSAALCYGMSVHRSGKNPAVITMRRSAD